MFSPDNQGSWWFQILISTTVIVRIFMFKKKKIFLPITKPLVFGQQGCQLLLNWSWIPITNFQWHPFKGRISTSNLLNSWPIIPSPQLDMGFLRKYILPRRQDPKPPQSQFIWKIHTENAKAPLYYHRFFVLHFTLITVCTILCSLPPQTS